MLNRFSRTELLLGEENMSKLAQSKLPSLVLVA